MTPEELARQHIDQLLMQSGWSIQDVKAINLGAGLGIAVREFPTDAGPADYMLFIDRKAVGVIEAKPEGTTLGGVHEQTIKYGVNFPKHIPHVQLPLPFTYESTGIETYFSDLRDSDYRSRRVFTFHRPETLQDYLRDAVTLRGHLKQLPELDITGLRKCQIEAITKLEKSFHNTRPRALIQMATGSGKTFTAVSFVYRLITSLPKPNESCSWWTARLWAVRPAVSSPITGLPMTDGFLQNYIMSSYYPPILSIR
ncbi:MAG: DEAD/DEAH box helicase family protein [bacterium]